MSSVSDIKLIRTDTTLDLSQKAEKRYRTYPYLGGWSRVSSFQIWWTVYCRLQKGSVIRKKCHRLTTIAVNRQCF